MCARRGASCDHHMGFKVDDVEQLDEWRARFD
jgi:hypothetical protein